MDYSRIALFLLLVAVALPRPHGVTVTNEMIDEKTPAEVIGYRSSEDLDNLIQAYIDVMNTEQRWGEPLLPDQGSNNEPPRRWVPLDLEGRVPEDKTRVFTRDDNMYFSAFTNMSGHIHSLRGHEGAIANAIKLTLKDNYRAITGDSAKTTLPVLPLSKDLFDDDVHILARFPYVSNEDFHRAVARLVVMIIESSRIKPIRRRIKEIWESGGVGYIDEIHAQYCVNWSKMSLFMFCSEENIEFEGQDAQDMRKIKVSTMEEVKDIVAVFIRPVRFNPNNPLESCKKKNYKKAMRRNRKRGEGDQGSSGTIPGY